MIRSGRYFRWAIVLGVVVVLSSVLAACSQPAPAAPTPAAQKSGIILLAIPGAVVQGSPFDVAGTGFKPGESLVIKLLGKTSQDDQYLGSGIMVDETGAFSAACVDSTAYGKLLDAKQNALQLPDTPFTPGVYTLQASSTEGTLVTTPLIIKAKPVPATPKPSATPAPSPKPSASPKP